MIETIFLDLDNTILDFSMAERKALTFTLESLGIEPKEWVLQRYSQINLAQWKLLEQGKLTRDEVKLRRFRLLFEEMGVERTDKEAARIYEDRLAQGHYFMEGAEKLLETLHGKYRMFIVTNGTASVQAGRLKSADIGKYFENIFISEEVGHNKPGKEYFDCCFAEISGFNKDTAVIIGDSLTSDIQGGINAGIRSIWFNPGHEAADGRIIPDYETDSLSKIPALLAEI